MKELDHILKYVDPMIKAVGQLICLIALLRLFLSMILMMERQKRMIIGLGLFFLFGIGGVTLLEQEME